MNTICTRDFPELAQLSSPLTADDGLRLTIHRLERRARYYAIARASECHMHPVLRPDLIARHPDASLPILIKVVASATQYKQFAELLRSGSLDDLGDSFAGVILFWWDEREATPADIADGYPRRFISHALKFAFNAGEPEADGGGL
jgi:hypothetical protein